MDALAVGLRLILIGVFGVSGIAKLADPRGTREAVAGFGVPDGLAGATATLLPYVEIATAVLIALPATVAVGGIAALLLLVVFVVGIVINLTRGSRPDCHCFGQIHSAPIGWKTVARNVALGAASLVVLVRDAAWADPFRWAEGLGSTDRGLVVAVAVLSLVALGQGWFTTRLRADNQDIKRRLDELSAGSASTQVVTPPKGLPIGTKAPDFSLAGLHGDTITLESLRAAGRPLLLLFTDPGCGPCNTLMPDVGEWQRRYADRLTVALVSRRSVDDNLPKAQEHGLSNVLLQKDHEVAEAYNYVGTPSAVVVDDDGRIASELVGGAPAIRELVGGVVGEPVEAGTVEPEPREAQPIPEPLAVGAEAPGFQLPDLDGNKVALEDFRGRATLVVFWNPGCEFCRRALPELKAIENDPPQGVPQLVFVSLGDVETNRALGLTSPILLDESFDVAAAFGASGTPMGVLVDAEGRVAGELAIGGAAVLDLARRGDEFARR